MEKFLPEKTRIYISPCSKHHCTGTPFLTEERYLLKGIEKVYTMTRCTTCGKLFARGGDVQELGILGQRELLPYTICSDENSLIREDKTLYVRIEDQDVIDHVILTNMAGERLITFEKTETP